MAPRPAPNVLLIEREEARDALRFFLEAFAAVTVTAVETNVASIRLFRDPSKVGSYDVVATGHP